MIPWLSKARGCGGALRILDGEKVGDIAVIVGVARPRLATNAALGISESNLPSGSQIYFREPTVAVFLANRDDHRRYSLALAYFGPAP